VVIWAQTSQHLNMGLAIAIAIAISAAAGALNGILIVRLRINSFIVTLGTATVFTAVQGIVSGEQQPLPPITPAWGNLTQTTIGGFQIVLLYLIVIALIVWWALEHTPGGRYVYATGGNINAARLAGVRVDLWMFVSFVVSATLSGVVGVLYGSLYGPALSYGQVLLLPAFAAVFLGSTQLKRGRYNVWGSLIAVYVLATGVEGLSLLTGVQWLNDMFDGIALIVAVGFAGWRQRQAVSFSLKRRSG
jgi:ribose transport system permease protein